MDDSFAITCILLGTCGLVTAYSLSIFIAVFQFGYLDLGAQHRKAIFPTFVLGFSTQAVVIYAHFFDNDFAYCIFGTAVYSFTMALVLTELYFCETVLPVTPLLSKKRINCVRWTVGAIYMVLMASFFARFVMIGMGLYSESTYLVVKNINDLLALAFQLSNVASGPPLKLYCISCLAHYSSAKSTRGETGTKILRLTKLSLLNFCIDLSSYLLALSPFWAPAKWKQGAAISPVVLLLHCIVYCYIFNHVVQVTFPRQYSAKIRKMTKTSKMATEVIQEQLQQANVSFASKMPTKNVVI